MKKLSKLLAIDTATNYVYLSLVLDGREASRRYQPGQNDHSVTVMPLIEEMLGENHLSVKDLDGILCGVGPGSYTGVRIGVSIAKMISYLNHIPLYQVSTLALMASHSGSDWILPEIDARRNRAFMALFSQKNNKLTYQIPDTLEDVGVFESAIEKPFVRVSEGCPEIGKILASGLYEFVDDVHGLEPNYLQVTEAEKNRNAS